MSPEFAPSLKLRMCDNVTLIDTDVDTHWLLSTLVLHDRYYSMAGYDSLPPFRKKIPFGPTIKRGENRHAINFKNFTTMR